MRLLMRLLVCLSLLFILGCSYNSKLPAPLATTRIALESARPISIVVDGRNIYGSKVIATPGLVTLTVDYGDALLELIKQNALNRFATVHLIRTDDDLPAKYDYLLNIKTSNGGMCGGTSCYLQTLTSIDIKKRINDKTFLLSENFSDQYAWQQPGSAVALGLLSGLTLCAICPITGPIGVHIEGEELSNQVSMSNHRIATRIDDILRTSDIFE